jgi:hypothetical protein
MKKTILLVSIFALLSGGYGQAQEIFTDTLSKKDYLFLGSVSADKGKAKMLEKGKIVWKWFNEIEQTDLLDSKAFTEEIFKYNMQFYLEGYEPFFSAALTADTLTFFDTETGDARNYPIKILTKDHTTDGAIFLMFSNENGTAFGVIDRPSGMQQMCKFIIAEEEKTLYRTFFSVENKVYNGCVTIIQK